VYSQASLVDRLTAGLGRSHNWFQLIRFGMIGGTCYAVNVGTFAIAVELLDFHYLAAATMAFVCAVTSSFFGHRVVTFRAVDQRILRQAPRFISVYLPAAVFAAGVLQLGVMSGLPEVGAQALSMAIAAPLSFVANKVWSFAPAAETGLR
jgi:putative flippase GtrA